MEHRPFDAIADHALTMGLIPLIGIFSGRHWPYLLSLPLVALPITGKTLRHLSYREDLVAVVPGWCCFVIAPLTLMLLAAVCLERAAARGQNGRSFCRWALVLTVWFYLIPDFPDETGHECRKSLRTSKLE